MYRSKITGKTAEIIDTVSDGRDPEEFVIVMSDGMEFDEDQLRFLYEEVK